MAETLFGSCKLGFVCVCLCVSMPGNTQPSLWEHIQHYRGAHQHRCLFLTLDLQKKGGITVGYSHRGVREKSWAFWKDFKISILVILYGSDSFDLAAARYRCMCERERE